MKKVKIRRIPGYVGKRVEFSNSDHLGKHCIMGGEVIAQSLMLVIKPLDGPIITVSADKVTVVS